MREVIKNVFKKSTGNSSVEERQRRPGGGSKEFSDGKDNSDEDARIEEHEKTRMGLR